MKVVSITPIHVTEEELKRRQARYERLAPAGITVELRNLSEQSLNALEKDSDVRASDLALLADALEINLEIGEVLLPDCILDPDSASTLALPRLECWKA